MRELYERLYRSFVSSSRLFLYLGFGLILLALICLPVRVRYVVQPEVMEYEEAYLGPVFTFLLGFWALASLVLGVMESSRSRRAVLSCLIPILCLVDVVSASALWFQAFTFGSLPASGWIILGLLILLPTILMNVAGLSYVVDGAGLTMALKNPRIRLFFLTLLLVVPSFFAIALFMNVIMYF